MTVQLNGAMVELGSGRPVAVHDAAGTTVLCRAGRVWITQQDDARDVVLAAGESFVLDRAGLALLSGLPGAAVQLLPPAGSAASVRAPAAVAAC